MAEADTGRNYSQEERRTLGAHIAAARKAAGYTQEGVAAELEVIKQTVSSWENGRNLPEALTLRRLARLYRTSLDALVGNQVGASWPFSKELHEKVLRLRDEELLKVENLLRWHFNMEQMNLSDFANTSGQSKELSSSQHRNVPYAGTPEDGAGLPPHIGIDSPASNSNGGREKVHRPAQQKGRGST